MSRGRSINLILLAVIFATFGTGLLLLMVHERGLEARSAEHLKTMLMLRESVLKTYFESLRSEVALWAGQPIVVEILERLNRPERGEDVLGIGSMRTGDITGMAEVDAGGVLDERVRDFARHHDYYDVFFIGPDGDVLYTMAREADYQTNLINGPYADSGLGRLFRKLSAAVDVVAFEDFSLYAPSAGLPAAFIGTSVVANDGRFLGVYAVQIPEEPVNRIMAFSAGMGETGEIYLVGEDGLMRSRSRFFDESTVLRSEVTGATFGKALNGESGLEIVDDYRGTPVYSVYRPFDFEGVRWAVLAEQDVAEVRQPLRSARLWLAAAFVLVCLGALVLRVLLIRAVLPSSLMALVGLSLIQREDG
jgi:methyl-accepting chemotaxis protein